MGAGRAHGTTLPGCHVFLCPPLQGESRCRESPPSSVFSPRDPPGAPRTSASPRCTRRAGSAAKPATWARGWCSPAGSTRPSASPAWTVSTCSPNAKGAGHRGGLRGPPAGTGVLSMRIPLGELCGCTSCCSLQPPGAQFLHKRTQMAGFLAGFPPILQPSAQQIPTPDPTTALFQDLLVPGMFAGPLPGLCLPAPPQHCPPKLTHTAVTQRATCTIANFTL